MDNLIIEATKYTPKIHFDCKNNVFEIKGESYPENIGKVYESVFAWLKDYIAQLQNQQTVVNIELIYFNSSSSKVLINMFDMFEEAMEDDGKKFVVNWIYDHEDENSLEFGEEFQEDLELIEFNLIGKD
jgi:hypothetical protein